MQNNLSPMKTDVALLFDIHEICLLFNAPAVDYTTAKNHFPLCPLICNFVILLSAFIRNCESNTRYIAIIY